MTPEMPPKVSGRHRNRVLAADRRACALRLRREGKTYREIADVMGYSGPGQVCRMVNKAVDGIVVAEATSLRDQQWARLDRLERSLWPMAQTGDIKAIHELRGVIMARVKLLGLETVDVAPKMPRTVINPEGWS